MHRHNPPQADARQGKCANPVWPCAMVGAAACLAGIRDLAVIIHGSSGCYFYPSTVIPATLYGTFLVEEEVIFGSEKRLREVIDGLKSGYRRIAVINSCVPAVVGEDLSGMLDDEEILFVDSPGFTGPFEEGYMRALELLGREITYSGTGVNIDGICLFDPFHRGNVQETKRLLSAAHLETGTIYTSDSFEKLASSGPFTIGTNPDLKSGFGSYTGGLLGLDAVAETFHALGDKCGEADIDAVLRERGEAEERIVYACEKYLRRFDPPNAAIFGGFSYAGFIAKSLARYLDAGIGVIGSRNGVHPSPFPVSEAEDQMQVAELIRDAAPDLLLGSAYDRAAAPGIPFVGVTPPLRGRYALSARPIAGVEGSLCLFEDVLNACMDSRPGQRI